MSLEMPKLKQMVFLLISKIEAFASKYEHLLHVANAHLYTEKNKHIRTMDSHMKFDYCITHIKQMCRHMHNISVAHDT